MTEEAGLSADQIIDALRTFDFDGLFAISDPDQQSLKLDNSAAASSDPAARQAIGLLAGISSLKLDADKWDSPYRPWLELGTQRSFVPEDLGPLDLDVLRWFAEHPTGPAALRARAADLVWLQSLDRRADAKFARLAVQLRARESVTAETWIRAGRESLARAISMARRLRMLDELEAIQTTILSGLQSTDRGWFAAQCADFLADNGLLGGKTEEILAGLERSLSELNPEFRATESLLDSKARILRVANREEDAAQAEEAHIELLIEQAELRSQESQLIAAPLLEGAYQRARRIPRKQRSVRINYLIATLPGRIRKAGELALEDMSAFEAGQDITEAVEAVRAAVRGRSVEEALAGMVIHAPYSRFSKTRDEAEKLLSGSISGLFGRATFASDGRKIDSSAVKNYYDLPANLWHQMMHLYELHISIYAVGVIGPAMEIISTEHRLTFADLHYLVRKAPIVPHHVEVLFATGLYYGVTNEWAAALHLLTPQIEAIVRYHLREAGVDTERIDPEYSISTETGISTLMKSPVADDVFGENLAWEIRALLCGPAGPNLRNVVAHGLVGAGVANGPHAMYLWLFALRLVFLPYYNPLRDDEPDGADRDAAEQQSDEP